MRLILEEAGWGYMTYGSSGVYEKDEYRDAATIARNEMIITRSISNKKQY